MESWISPQGERLMRCFSTSSAAAYAMRHLLLKEKAN